MDPTFQRCMTMPLQQLDFELSPSRSAKDANGSLAKMVSQTSAALADPFLRVKTDIAYGPRPRQRLDVFNPVDAGRAAPCLVFIHGGFWQEGDKSVSGLAAQCFGGLGWSYVSVGYTLTPDVTLTELTQEIYAALSYLHQNAAALDIDPDRIVVAGHSAGGHLAGCLVADVFEQGITDFICGAVLISGVFELSPIARSYVNDLSQINAEEQRRLSPLRYQPSRRLPVHVLIGAEEPAAFQEQSAALAAQWTRGAEPLTTSVAQGRDHFDVLEELNDPHSVTVQTILSWGRSNN